MSDSTTKEALAMITSHEDEDVMFGRMPVGFDLSEYDALPPREEDIAKQEEVWANGDGTAEFIEDTLQGEDETPVPFVSPAPEVFPIYKQALKHFQAEAPKSKVVRVDTDDTYNDFVSQKVVDELARRVEDLQAAFDTHLEDYHGTQRRQAKRAGVDVLGAAQAVAQLSQAQDAHEAAAAMPQVPVDLPPFAEGKIKIWKDGDNVICSLRFCSADGKPRVATMAARPQIDMNDIANWIARAGVDPVTVLGVLPDLADVACGKRLVRDVAGAALEAQRRSDVCGMDGDEDAEPLLLTSPSGEDTAPLAALMYVEQKADAGNSQAQREMKLLQVAAQTPAGQQIAAPILAESTKRLEKGREMKALAAPKRTLADYYNDMMVFV
jgi:hypothetical protein